MASKNNYAEQGAVQQYMKCFIFFFHMKQLLGIKHPPQTEIFTVLHNNNKNNNSLI